MASSRGSAGGGAVPYDDIEDCSSEDENAPPQLLRQEPHQEPLPAERKISTQSISVSSEDRAVSVEARLGGSIKQTAQQAVLQGCGRGTRRSDAMQNAATETSPIKNVNPPSGLQSGIHLGSYQFGGSASSSSSFPFTSSSSVPPNPGTSSSTTSTSTDWMKPPHQQPRTAAVPVIFSTSQAPQQVLVQQDEHPPPYANQQPITVARSASATRTPVSSERGGAAPLFQPSGTSERGGGGPVFAPRDRSGSDSSAFARSSCTNQFPSFGGKQTHQNPFGTANATQFGAPGNYPNQFGARAANPNQFGAAPVNTNQFGAPVNTMNQFGAPVNPNQFGAPVNPNQFGALPPGNASQFGSANQNLARVATTDQNAFWAANPNQLAGDSRQFGGPVAARSAGAAASSAFTTTFNPLQRPAPVDRPPSAAKERQLQQLGTTGSAERQRGNHVSPKAGKETLKTHLKAEQMRSLCRELKLPVGGSRLEQMAEILAGKVSLRRVKDMQHSSKMWAAASSGGPGAAASVSGVSAGSIGGARGARPPPGPPGSRPRGYSVNTSEYLRRKRDVLKNFDKQRCLQEIRSWMGDESRCRLRHVGCRFHGCLRIEEREGVNKWTGSKEIFLYGSCSKYLEGCRGTVSAGSDWYGVAGNKFGGGGLPKWPLRQGYDQLLSCKHVRLQLLWTSQSELKQCGLRVRTECDVGREVLEKLLWDFQVESAEKLAFFVNAAREKYEQGVWIRMEGGEGEAGKAKAGGVAGTGTSVAGGGAATTAGCNAFTTTSPTFSAGAPSIAMRPCSLRSYLTSATMTNKQASTATSTTKPAPAPPPRASEISFFFSLDDYEKVLGFLYGFVKKLDQWRWMREVKLDPPLEYPAAAGETLFSSLNPLEQHNRRSVKNPNQYWDSLQVDPIPRLHLDAAKQCIRLAQEEVADVGLLVPLEDEKTKTTLLPLLKRIAAQEKLDGEDFFINNVRRSPLAESVREAALSLHNVPGSLWARLAPYQREGVLRILVQNKGRALLADHCGLGKSAQSLAVLASLASAADRRSDDDDDEQDEEEEASTASPWPALIVCPASCRANWAVEVEKWLSPVLSPTDIYCARPGSYQLDEIVQEYSNQNVVNDNDIDDMELQKDENNVNREQLSNNTSKNKRNKRPPRGRRRKLLCITSYHMAANMGNQFLKIPWGFCVCDEVHQFLTPKIAFSKKNGARLCHDGASGGGGLNSAEASRIMEATMAVLSGIPRMILLSGTPLGAASHVTSIYHIAKLVGGGGGESAAGRSSPFYSLPLTHTTADDFLLRNFDLTCNSCERTVELSRILRDLTPIIRREKADVAGQIAKLPPRFTTLLQLPIRPEVFEAMEAFDPEKCDLERAGEYASEMALMESKTVAGGRGGDEVLGDHEPRDEEEDWGVFKTEYMRTGFAKVCELHAAMHEKFVAGGAGGVSTFSTSTEDTNSNTSSSADIVRFFSEEIFASQTDSEMMLASSTAFLSGKGNSATVAEGHQGEEQGAAGEVGTVDPLRDADQSETGAAGTFGKTASSPKQRRGHQKVVIFTRHHRVTDRTEDMLRDVGRDLWYDELVKIDGRVPHDERVQLVERFGDPAYRAVAICGMEAMGTGINGLQAASCAIFLELPTTADLMEQCMSRLHRHGQTAASGVHFYVLLGKTNGWLQHSISGKRIPLEDEQRWAAILEKQQTHDEFFQKTSNAPNKDIKESTPEQRVAEASASPAAGTTSFDERDYKFIVHPLTDNLHCFIRATAAAPVEEGTRGAGEVVADFKFYRYWKAGELFCGPSSKQADPEKKEDLRALIAGLARDWWEVWRHTSGTKRAAVQELLTLAELTQKLPPKIYGEKGAGATVSTTGAAPAPVGGGGSSSSTDRLDQSRKQIVAGELCKEKHQLMLAGRERPVGGDHGATLVTGHDDSEIRWTEAKMLPFSSKNANARAAAAGGGFPSTSDESDPGSVVLVPYDASANRIYCSQAACSKLAKGNNDAFRGARGRDNGNWIAFAHWSELYCSNQCYEDARMVGNRAEGRTQCWRFERGVCQDCGVDTEKLRMQLVKKFAPSRGIFDGGNALDATDVGNILARGKNKKLQLAAAQREVEEDFAEVGQEHDEAAAVDEEKKKYQGPLLHDDKVNERHEVEDPARAEDRSLNEHERLQRELELELMGPPAVDVPSANASSSSASSAGRSAAAGSALPAAKRQKTAASDRSTSNPQRGRGRPPKQGQNKNKKKNKDDPRAAGNKINVDQQFRTLFQWDSSSTNQYWETPVPPAWQEVLGEQEWARYLRETVNFRGSRVGLSSPLWQADHELAVMHGGGQCGKANFQTLCVACHRKKTNADLAIRRTANEAARQRENAERKAEKDRAKQLRKEEKEWEKAEEKERKAREKRSAVKSRAASSCSSGTSKGASAKAKASKVVASSTSRPKCKVGEGIFEAALRCASEERAATQRRLQAALELNNTSKRKLGVDARDAVVGAAAAATSSASASCASTLERRTSGLFDASGFFEGFRAPRETSSKGCEVESSSGIGAKKRKLDAQVQRQKQQQAPLVEEDGDAEVIILDDSSSEEEGRDGR